jgi:hypothetical protein
VIALELLPSGGARAVTAAYELSVDAGGDYAWFGPPGGATRQGCWLRLCLLAAADPAGGRDETVASGPVERAGEHTLVVRRRSSCWRAAGLRIELGEERIELTAYVDGEGRLGELRLLGGRVAAARAGERFSGSRLGTLFSPNPEDPQRPLRSSREPVVIGVSGDALPGRGHWFFTPAPLFLALAPGGDGDPSAAGSPARAALLAAAAATARRGGAPGAAPATATGEWLGIGLVAPVGELGFGELAYRSSDDGFELVMDYEGHTALSGRFESPAVVLQPGCADPFAGLAAHRELLAARGIGTRTRTETAGWWTDPMFCGWGAQCARAVTSGGTPQAACTQQGYDRFLAELAEKGLHPPTIVVDDGWQAAYGRSDPDPARWPDLAGWIAARHGSGQHVLLWWPAWEAEGVPPELCVRDAAGSPVALDPRSAAGRRLLADCVAEMLSPGGLDADGLKVDFTARTPLGASLRPQGSPWGIALLHDLLSVIYRAAKSAKPDALVITHAPHPSFAGVADMIRLNDILRLDDPVPAAPVVEQMTLRAAVVAAACPQLLVDTDDWCMPDRAQWREYLAVKGELGVPALYYTTHLDRTGERLEDRDYEALAALWSRAATAPAVTPSGQEDG